jgi:hypothetical protein
MSLQDLSNHCTLVTYQSYLFLNLILDILIHTNSCSKLKIIILNENELKSIFCQIILIFLFSISKPHFVFLNLVLQSHCYDKNEICFK